VRQNLAALPPRPARRDPITRHYLPAPGSRRSAATSSTPGSHRPAITSSAPPIIPAVGEPTVG